MLLIFSTFFNMENKAQEAGRRALQRWEGEGGAIAEGPQQVHVKTRTRATNPPKRIANVAEDDHGGGRRGRNAN